VAQTEGKTMNALTTAQADFLADVDLLAISRDSRSGGEWADLKVRMHRSDARCVACDLPTVLTSGRTPAAATLGTLIPCVLTDDNNGRDRLGYVPGNVALFCRACVDAANDYGNVTGEPVVWTADALVGAARVWLAWPALGKRKTVRVTDHTADARVARMAAGLPF